MLSKYIYKHCYIPEDKYDRQLYKKALSFTHTIPFITDRMWTYITGNITKEHLFQYLSEQKNEYTRQVPTCQFGIFLYHTCFQYCTNVLNQDNYKVVCGELGISKQELFIQLRTDSISLYTYIQFVHSIKANHLNKWSVLPIYRVNITLCCPTFIHACKHKHIPCMEQYVNHGVPFYSDINQYIVSTNSIECVKKMESYGFVFDKDCMMYACKHKLWDVFQYGITSKSIPFHITDGLTELPTTEKLQLLEEYTTKYPADKQIKELVDYYWVYIDAQIYPMLYSIISDKELQNKRLQQIYNIEANIRNIFHASITCL